MRITFRLAAASLGTMATIALSSCTPEMATAPAVDPAAATYAAALGVNLASMTKTASGLYYQDVPPGTGTAAVSGNHVTVHYTGYLTNGSTFDTSIGKTPFGFTLGQGAVIAGWDEGVVGMKIGGTRKLVIPAALAYGAGSVGSIPANSILVFNVQLISIP
ncbi:MAG: FKBP-type peptidyl-prolyl cis-trans isomerase [Gemmatimonadetes bacterium]|nr:FKBP-type peptidyl-prolyl cis-trans isomerase [Gemmatimonadota bacterium]